MAAERGQFNSRIGFVLAAAGSAVGLGNIWGFPFQVGKGGGAAFVVIYLVFCFIPILLLENMWIWPFIISARSFSERSLS